MLLALFFIILLSPCVVAFVADEMSESSPWEGWSGSLRTLPRWRRANVTATAVREQEIPLFEGFVVRSFAKGLSQRRTLVQDFTEGVRQTIVEVRAVVAHVAKAAEGAYQFIRETRAELLARLAHQARIVLAQDIVRNGRRSRAAGKKYAQACARLRWSEIMTEAQWSEAFVAERVAA